jgi:hypothetical protein
MQLTHEVKVCHGDYLVNHLPHCVCDNCSQFRHERGIQMWNDCYPGNWFPKFSINRKEQKLLPICLRLLTLLTIIKDPLS